MPKRSRYSDVQEITDASLEKLREAVIIDLIEAGAGEEGRRDLAENIAGLIKRLDRAEGRKP